MPAGKSSHDPGVAKLVERQMRNWELARAQRVTVPEPQRKEVESFVCISRCVGAGGKEVASLLAEKLGWPVFDKEILDRMAGDDELRRQVYESMDERDVSWYEETLRSLMQREFVKNDYFHKLSTTVLSLARQGHAVFLGRGIDQILPRTIGFRVRLVAPLEQCIERYARLFSLTLGEARGEVVRLEQQRSEFIRRHFGIGAGEATRNDLLINMARWTPAQAVELILSARKILGVA